MPRGLASREDNIGTHQRVLQLIEHVHPDLFANRSQTTIEALVQAVINHENRRVLAVLLLDQVVVLVGETVARWFGHVVPLFIGKLRRCATEVSKGATLLGPDVAVVPQHHLQSVTCAHATCLLKCAS